MENILVLKIGGSILDHPLVLDDFIHVFCANLNPKWKYALLVGGGNKCNQLREQYKSTVISEEINSYYHWKSIKVMGDNAKMLHSKLVALSEKTPCHLIKDISSSNIKTPGIYIIQPFEHFSKFDPLEHSWRVTSDSIAIYYANRLQSQICLLVKNKPYFKIDEVDVNSILSSKLLANTTPFSQNGNLGKGLVDPLGPYLCREYKIPILILDGTNIRKVTDFFSNYSLHTEIMKLSSFGIEISPY